MGRTALRLASRSPPKTNGTACAFTNLSTSLSPSSSSRVVRFVPVDVSDVTLPPALEATLVDNIAENMHEVWSKGLLDRGWSFAPERNDELKKHHLLVPYSDLTPEEKSYDVDLSRDTLRVLIKKGFGFKRTGKDMSAQLCMKLDEKFRQPNGYLPHPLEDRHVELSADLMMLGEMLAENMHNVWACKKMGDGWTYARTNDPVKRHSPNLLPFCELTEDAQFSNRNSSLSILRMLSVLGYSIVPKEDLETPGLAKILLLAALLLGLLAVCLKYVNNV